MCDWTLSLTVVSIFTPIVVTLSPANSDSSKIQSNSCDDRGYAFNDNLVLAFSRTWGSQENKTLFLKTYQRAQEWKRLFLEGREVILYMYVSHESTRSSNVIKTKTFMFICTAEISTVMSTTLTNLMFRNKTTKTIVFEVSTLCSRQEVLGILLGALDLEANIIGVVVASSHANCVSLILDTVASEPVFKWSRFLHLIEWIAMLIDPPSTNKGILFPRQTSFPDFVTLIFVREEDGVLELNVAQKSRTEKFETGSQLSLYSKSDTYYRFRESWCSPQVLLNRSILSTHLRKNAALYLLTKKSVMADMLIPAAFIVSEPDKNAYKVNNGNQTIWEGFSVDVLNLLSTALGFTSLPFAVTDGGFFGLFESNGNIIGVAGYLSRREAGLSTMTLMRTEERLKHIDYVYPSIVESRLYLMYKVESRRTLLGDFYIELAKSNLEFVVLLLCPCVALVAGVTVFLVNGVLVSGGHILGRNNLKRLYDFPFHCVFHTNELCRHQSGRVLRATWGLFCVIMFAAFGALMTSTATAPVEWPVISDLKDLLSHPEIAIGISPTSSQTITDLSSAKPGTTFARVWQALVECNRSDARTFSPDKGYHIRKVLQGGYAYLSDVPKGLVPSYVDADFSHVKFIELNYDQLYAATPQNVFYRDDIERALLAATDSGTIRCLFNKWIPPGGNMTRAVVENQTVVNVPRLRVLLIITASGIALAGLTLIVEQLLHLRNRGRQ
ncbi:glutamate receptor, ionotropic kainate [Plakobranchus ocellatus]|uniref:Glutamate receptor, ionotropic kainate n=1 Tax=Plakobranchus ocellatus TaxID=259542 RepID=A0AAV3YK75_9GAST|nr:glutamate receptor, ionotropic kainate [Plakobranchus ocellatus]